jgi:hypothetical protein
VHVTVIFSVGMVMPFTVIVWLAVVVHPGPPEKQHESHLPYVSVKLLVVELFTLMPDPAQLLLVKLTDYAMFARGIPALGKVTPGNCETTL